MAPEPRWASSNDCRPSSSVVTSLTATSGAGPSVGPPNVTTCAAVRPAIAATRSSSALSTAVPSAGSASTISPLACAIASRLPNSPMWAVPTLSTAATCGRRDGAQLGDVPDAAGPHLDDEVAGVGVARSTVSGTPSSLLKLPRVATVGPASDSRWAR